MSPFLIPDLKRDEGFRAKAYPDPLSGGEPWTVGYGFTGPDIGPRTTMTLAEADAEIVRRTTALASNLLSALPWLAGITPLRQDVLCNMAYNMGLHGLLGFKHTLACVQADLYDDAATAMLASQWARQVPSRAHRLAEQMRTDEHV